MRVGVFGAGSIGCYLGGILAAGRTKVVLVGRLRLKTEIDSCGLTLRDLDGRLRTVEPGTVEFSTDPESLRRADLVLVAVKSAGTGEAAATLARVLPPSAIVVSMQNGLHNADELRTHLPKHAVLAGIVGFNVLAKGEGIFLRATSGPLVIEASADTRIANAATVWRAAGLDIERHDQVRPLQWSKLVMNLNNAVSALSGAPLPQLLFDPAYRRIVRAVIGEGVAVIRRARVATTPFGGVPVSLFPTILGLPTPLLRIVLRAQLRIDPEARSSMWEDLTLGRRTEVEELNGEIVRLAHSVGSDAPINRRVCTTVHEAEARGPGSPGLSASALASALGLA